MEIRKEQKAQVFIEVLATPNALMAMNMFGSTTSASAAVTAGKEPQATIQDRLTIV